MFENNWARLGAGRLRVVKYAHANKLQQELSKRHWRSRDGGQVDIIAAQGAGELPDMPQCTNLARRSSNIPHLKTTHIKSEREVSKPTTVVLIEPDNREI